MARQEIPFTGGSKQHRSAAIANQLCVNWFTEAVVDDLGKTKSRVLIGAPGKTLLKNMGAAPLRALHMSSTDFLRYWAVFGSSVYEFRNDNTATLLGTLTTTQGDVFIADNGSHLCIVDGSTHGYYYQIAPNSDDEAPADRFAEITDPNFVGGSCIIFISGYFIVIQPNSTVAQSCTAPHGTAPTDWAGDDVYSTELVDSSPAVALGSINDLLWIFSEYNTVILQKNTDASGFPFSVIPGTTLMIGTSSKSGVKELNGSLIWPGKTKKGENFVVKSVGLSYVVVSDPATEYTIGKLSIKSDAYADVYTEETHAFYCLTYPTGNKSLVFDMSTGEWHERTSYGLGRNRAKGHIYFSGKHIVGDSTVGKLYTQSLDVFVEDTNPLVATRRCQHLQQGRQELEIPGLVVDCETGVGLQGTGQGSNPVMSLRYSVDGGRNWSSEITSEMGKIGDTHALVRFPRLGTGEDWVFEISVSDPVRRNVIGAWIDG